MKQFFYKDWSKFSMALVFLLLSVTLSYAQPSNDECAAAIELTLGASACDGNAVNATNVGATDSGTNPPCASHAGGDVWYYFIAPPSGEVTVRTSADGSGSITDTGIEVYDACGGAAIDCNDDNAGNLFSRLDLINLTPGQAYYVAAWEYGNNATGTFNICAWDTNPLCVAGQIVVDNSDCAEDKYSIDVTITEILTGPLVNITNDANTSQVLGVGLGTHTLTGFTSADGLVTVTVTDPNDASCVVSASVTMPTGCPPANDECANATPVPVGTDSCTTPVNGTNENATDSGVPHICIDGTDDGGYEGGDVWFSVVVPASGNVTIETSDDGSGLFDTVIEVYDACGGIVLGCDDDIVFEGGGFSNLTLTGQTPGTTLYIAVWEHENDAIGSFNICAYEPITTPDDCIGAEPLPVGDGSCTDPVIGTNDNATDSGIPHSCAFYVDNDVWFSFVAPQSGEVTIETSEDIAAFDTGVSIYDACGGTELYCDDDGATTPGNYSLIVATGLTPGQTYYVAVWEYGGGTVGTFNICAWDPNPTCTPPADPVLDIVDNACPVTTGSISATGAGGTLTYYTGATAAEANNNAINDLGGSATPPAYLPFPDVVYVCVVEEDATGCRSNPICGETAPVDCCIPPADPVLSIIDNACPAVTGSISATGGTGTLFYYTGATAAEASANANNDIGGSITAPAYLAFPNIVYVCVVEDDGTGCRSNVICGETAPIDCCTLLEQPTLDIVDNVCPVTTGTISATSGAGGTLFYYTGATAAEANSNATNDIGGSTTPPAYLPFPDVVYVCVVEDDGTCRSNPVCGQTAPVDCCIYPDDPLLTITDNNCPTDIGTISATGGTGTLFYYTGASATEASDNAANDIGGSTTPPAYLPFPDVVYVCVVEDLEGCRSNIVCGETAPTECCDAPIATLTITNNVCPNETGSISADGDGGSITYYEASDAATALDNATNDVNGSVFTPTYPAFPAVTYICVVSELAGCRSEPVCDETMPTNCACTPPADPSLKIDDNICPDTIGAITGIGAGGTIHYYTGVDGLDAFNNATNNTNGSTTPPAYEVFPTVVYVCIVEEAADGCRSNVVCDQTNPEECIPCDVPLPTLTIADNECPAETGSISGSASVGFAYYYLGATAEEAFDNAINNTNANFFPPPYPAFPEVLHICVVAEANGCRTAPVCGATMPVNCNCTTPADPVLTITDNDCDAGTDGAIEATGGTGVLYYYTGATAQEASDNADLDVGGSTTPPVYTSDTLYVCVVEDDGTNSGCRSNPVCGQTAPTTCCVQPDPPLLTIMENNCDTGMEGSIEANGGTGVLYYYTGATAQEASDNAVLDFGGSTTPPVYTSDTLYICVVEDDGTNSGCRSNPVCGQTAPTECAPVCPDDYADGGLPNSLAPLTGNLDEVRDYEADGTIQSDQIIGSVTATVVDYDSATDIDLLPGFEVTLGTIFSAFIDGCNDGQGGEIENPAATDTNNPAQKKGTEKPEVEQEKK